MLPLVFCCLFALAAGAENVVRLPVNDATPIKEVHYNHGLDDHQRVTYLKAIIKPSHVNLNGDRINFPASGYLDTYFKEGAVAGDERGHLVGSQFSGPAEWYNLSPQNSRVNRNEGYRSLTTDWYGSECEVRRFLDEGGNRHVLWEVSMTYDGNSNRPSSYHLKVTFYVDGADALGGIVTDISNPTLKEDSTFWTCRLCGASRHANDDIRKGVGCLRKK